MLQGCVGERVRGDVQFLINVPYQIRRGAYGKQSAAGNLRKAGTGV